MRFTKNWDSSKHPRATTSNSRYKAGEFVPNDHVSGRTQYMRLRSGPDGSYSENYIHADSLSSKKATDPDWVKQYQKLRGQISDIISDFPYETTNQPFLIRRYKSTEAKGKFEIKSVVALMVTWDAVCHIIAQAYGPHRLSNKNFGTGIVIDDNTIGHAYDGANGIKYVCVNPIFQRDSIKQAAGSGEYVSLAARMHTVACHELAHLSGMAAGHGEQYSMLREHIQLDTAYLLPVITKLCERCFPRSSRRDIKSARAEDPKYQRVLAQARLRKVRQTEARRLQRELQILPSELFDDFERFVTERYSAEALADSRTDDGYTGRYYREWLRLRRLTESLRDGRE